MTATEILQQLLSFIRTNQLDKAQALFHPNAILLTTSSTGYIQLYTIAEWLIHFDVGEQYLIDAHEEHYCEYAFSIPYYFCGRCLYTGHGNGRMFIDGGKIQSLLYRTL